MIDKILVSGAALSLIHSLFGPLSLGAGLMISLFTQASPEAVVALLIGLAATVSAYSGLKEKKTMVTSVLLVFSAFLLFQASNWIWVYVAWEAATVATYFAIAPESRENARKALIVGRISSILMMLAIGIIFSMTKSFEFGALPAPAAFLIWVAVMAKASVFPFIWLEDSSYSSAPLSALVQFTSSSGIFLITRFAQDFVFIKTGIAFFGILSIALSFFKGFSESNIKRILAYSAIATSGLMFTVFDLQFVGNIFLIVSLARTAYLLMAGDFADQFLYGTDLGLNTKTLAGFASTLCLLSIAGFPNFGIYLIGEGKIFQAILVAVLSGIYLGNMQAKVFGGDVPVKRSLSTYLGVLLALVSLLFYPLSQPRAVDFFTVLALIAFGFLLLRIGFVVRAIEFISERLRVHFPNINSEQDLIEDWSYSSKELFSKVPEKIHEILTGSTNRDIAYIAISIILLVIGVKLC